MDISLPSKTFSCIPRSYRNISYPPTPHLDEEPSQPTLQIMSYDLATIPTTPMLLTYGLQDKANKSRHIRVGPLEGVSGSAMIALRKEPHFISVLQTAEKEIRNAMECLLKSNEFRKRSSSTSSGEAVAEWVGGFEQEDTDEVILDNFESENSYLEVKVPTVRVSCSCLTGCYKSVAFAEHPAGRPWPKEWAVNAEHRSILVYENSHDNTCS